MTPEQARALGAKLAKRAQFNPSNLPWYTLLGGAGLGGIAGLAGEKPEDESRAARVLRGILTGALGGGLGGVALAPLLYGKQLAPEGGYMDALSALFGNKAEAATKPPTAAPTPAPKTQSSLGERLGSGIGKTYGIGAGGIATVLAILNALKRRRLDKRMAYIATGGNKARQRALYKKVKRPLWKDLAGIAAMGAGAGGLGYYGGKYVGGKLGDFIEDRATGMSEFLQPFARTT
jgi:hypothetical protein